MAHTRVVARAELRLCNNNRWQRVEPAGTPCGRVCCRPATTAKTISINLKYMHNFVPGAVRCDFLESKLIRLEVEGRPICDRITSFDSYGSLNYLSTINLDLNFLNFVASLLVCQIGNTDKFWQLAQRCQIFDLVTLSNKFHHITAQLVDRLPRSPRG